MTRRTAGLTLVTGASGFVGSALTARLATLGARVRALLRDPARVQLPSGVDAAVGDLTDPASLLRAADGVETVFHVGGLVAHAGCRRDFARVNVDGTRALLWAARCAGVRRFILTSTPSVIADGTDHFGVDESTPIARRSHSDYAWSKAVAAHTGEFRTLALRPHLVWGPRGSHWVDGFLRHAQGRATGDGTWQVGSWGIGNGQNRVGMTYIDDCVSAHLAAAAALMADASVGGAPYFVHGGEPVVLWDWVAALCRACHLEPPARRLPAPLARALGHAGDLLRQMTGGRCNPQLSRYLVDELVTDHYSDVRRARERLGYAPAVSVAEGIRRVATAYHAARESRVPPASVR
jgi:2-alkyl-3-oxoalkanoate reductase